MCTTRKEIQEKLEEKGWIKPVEPVLKEPTPQGMGPSAITTTKDGEYAYVCFHLSDNVFKISLKDLAIEAAADLSDYFPLQCYNIALDISEEKLFVHTASRQKLLVFDTQTMDVIHTIDNISTSGMYRSMLQSQYGPFLIVWDGGNTMKFVNTETYEVSDFTDNSIAFTQIQESKSNQNEWYVASLGPERWTGPEGWKVGTYNYKLKKWSNSISVAPQRDAGGFMDLRLLSDESKAYVAVWGGFYPDSQTHGYGWIYSINLEDRAVKIIPIDGNVWSLEIAPDGRWLYAAADWPKPINANNIQVVDTQTDTIAGAIDLSNLALFGTQFTAGGGTQFSSVVGLQIDPANPRFLYAISNDANAFIRVDLDNRTLADALVFNEENFQPSFFVRRPAQATGYILISRSANAFELDLDKAFIKNIVKFPAIREDTAGYDVAVDDTGRLFIAQGEVILEVNATDMKLIKIHQLPSDIIGLWNFVLSKDQTKLYSIWSDEKYPPDTFLAINRTNLQVEARLKLEGGGFNSRPYELPDGPKLYVLGGYDWGSITIQVIETDNYTIKKTIIYDPPEDAGISAGPYFPFAYDSNSHTLFMGAGTVVLAVDTNTDEIKQVIDLRDVAGAIGLEPPRFVYVNAIGLVHQPQENYLYIAHLDRAFVSIYDLNNDRFLPQVIPLKGFFPSYIFANNDYSKIYSLNGRSDSVSVIDIKSKTIEKVIDLHAYK